jgi:hypothetical protein
VFVGAADDVFLEAAEEGGKAGASTESYYAEAVGKSFRFGVALFHAGVRYCRGGFILRKRI